MGIPWDHGAEMTDKGSTAPQIASLYTDDIPNGCHKRIDGAGQLQPDIAWESLGVPKGKDA